MEWGRVKYFLPVEDYRLVMVRETQRRRLSGKPSIQVLQRHEGHPSPVSDVGERFHHSPFCGPLPHIWKAALDSAQFYCCWVTLTCRNKERIVQTVISGAHVSQRWRFTLKDLPFCTSHDIMCYSGDTFVIIASCKWKIRQLWTFASSCVTPDRLCFLFFRWHLHSLVLC